MEGNNKKLFGQFGGQYVPETLMTALKQLEAGFEGIKEEKNFHKEYKDILKNYVGRPSSLYFAERLTKEVGGPKIYLKREDLNHTGAHKINNVIGQLLLAKKMGKKKVIAETGAGQHGVATATAAALFDMECTVFMGEEDIRRQKLNVFKMKLLGAKVESVTSGTRTLKDATNEAIRQWVRDPESTFYVIGSVVGPHPYPEMVGYFQQIIGEEVKGQLIEKEGGLPDAIVACVGGGSNAAGIFRPFLEYIEVALYGVEAGGLGLATPYHAAALNKGSVGVLHGMKTYLCQDEHGQILPVHSISAGLDYPGIGPEHAYYHEEKRVQYPSITDQEALEGFQLLSKIEGIIPALESAHAVAYGVKLAKEMNQDQVLVINLSGRGDKDVEQVKDHLDKENLRGSKGITHVMSKAKVEGRKIFIPYVTVGDPTLEDTLNYVIAMVKGGADIIELGVPYSDPLADGPTIQQAAGRALVNNISLKDVFNLVSELRKKEINLPIVLLTYFNSIYAYGTEKFAKECRQYGVDGVVIPDLPFEEKEEAYPLLKEQGIAPIPLLTPTSKERMKKIVASGEGFVYCVSSNGTTGERKALDENVKEYLQAITDVCDLPMAVGFGISSPEMAQAIAPYTDGVIVGSHIVSFIDQYKDVKKLSQLIKDYVEALGK